ncbi:MAG: hypothetical protein DYH03_11285 [Nitrospira sp. NTP1]|nr:hypothetical protein [Nitrospira sp. NTP1]
MSLLRRSHEMVWGVSAGFRPLFILRRDVIFGLIAENIGGERESMLETGHEAVSSHGTGSAQ